VKIVSGIGEQGSGRLNVPAASRVPVVSIASGSDPRSLTPAPVGRGHIVFDHVWFAYDGTDYVLKDVSFEVRPGERIGVVGATGAGKSTIINLLLRFYDVTRGRILVDGVDIRELELEKLRRLFSLVLQDVYLFSGTMAENIRLGNAAITDEGVCQAAATVHADRFIDRLPLGYASPVAERGATLSMGQKQLLSFARALAFDPRTEAAMRSRRLSACSSRLSTRRRLASPVSGSCSACRSSTCCSCWNASTNSSMNIWPVTSRKMVTTPCPARLVAVMSNHRSSL
jgi:ABC-type ATPase involved in cell division